MFYRFFHFYAQREGKHKGILFPPSMALQLTETSQDIFSCKCSPRLHFCLRPSTCCFENAATCPWEPGRVISDGQAQNHPMSLESHGITILRSVQFLNDFEKSGAFTIKHTAGFLQACFGFQEKHVLKMRFEIPRRILPVDLLTTFGKVKNCE